MTFETLMALATFAVATSVTPGPNNLMLLASGVNFGFWRTVPHMLGISFGFGLLLFCVGSGIGVLVAFDPTLHFLLKILGATYLLYLAWRIATAGAIGTGNVKSRPMNFFEAAAFQWVNPKAWSMALSATALFGGNDDTILGTMLIVTVFIVCNFPSVMIWTGFGTVMQRFLSNPTRLRVFNITMGVLLALTVIMVVR
ncbi:MAG: LysE family translocator [Hyphomicrobiales bacterium]